MILFLTTLSAIGGTLLGYGITRSRVQAAHISRDIAVRTMEDYRDGKLDVTGFRIGSAASWKESALEAQRMLIDSRRVNVRLMERNDVLNRVAGVYDDVLPEQNVYYDRFLDSLVNDPTIPNNRERVKELVREGAHPFAAASNG